MAKARVNRFALVDAPREDTGQPSAPAVRTTTTKVSVSLHSAPYYGLVDFCTEAGKARGRRVAHVDVFRALVALLLEDKELRARVIQRLRN
jgi:hypothetical protein